MLLGKIQRLECSSDIPSRDYRCRCAGTTSLQHRGGAGNTRMPRRRKSGRWLGLSVERALRSILSSAASLYMKCSYCLESQLISWWRHASSLWARCVRCRWVGCGEGERLGRMLGLLTIPERDGGMHAQPRFAVRRAIDAWN